MQIYMNKIVSLHEQLENWSGNTDLAVGSLKWPPLHRAPGYNNHDVSEHWLWSFELHKLNSIHPNKAGTATADKSLRESG